MHVGALAVQGGECTIAFHDEAQGVLHVPMRRRDFARQDQLEACIEGLSDSGLTGEKRVLED